MRNLEAELSKVRQKCSKLEKTAGELREQLELVWNSHVMVHLLACSVSESIS